MFARIDLGVRAVLLSCVAVSACSHPAEAAQQRPIPVRIHQVEPSSGAGPGRYAGTLEPAVRIELAFRVGGYVEAVAQVPAAGASRAAGIGDQVTKSTVLARLRSSEYEQKLATAKAQVGAARAAARLADDELARARRLFASEAITEAELDARVAQADSSRAQLDAARAGAEEAAIALHDTVLRAPMDGVILARQIEVGSLVAAGHPALALADTRKVKAVFGAPQALIGRLRIGSPVRVMAPADRGPAGAQSALDANVTAIAPAAESNGRVFTVEVELPNPERGLHPGSVVSIHVPDAELGQAPLVIPLNAVQRSTRDPHGFAVFVLTGSGDLGVARVRDVQLGEVLGNSVSVTAGLTRAERVVIAGAALLRDGSSATVIR